MFWLYSFSAFSQILSPQAEISLITVGPGKELYSSFGHSAIVIEDAISGVNIMYNYGTFDFNTENFYVKFLRGQLPYQLSKNEPIAAYNYWTYENRLITKQVLNLTLTQKQKVFDFLETNYLPANRTYPYKFFYDNCSTRLRDVIINACKDSLSFDSKLNAEKSYRKWIDQYAGHKKWADFGMDIALGFPADSVTGANGAMFIPDNLMAAFDKAKVKINGVEQPLVKTKNEINKYAITPPTIESTILSPVNIFSVSLLIGLIISLLQYKRQTYKPLFDTLIFSILGISGIILFLLWFFTDHGVTELNFNTLWAFPFIIPFFFITKTKQLFIKLYLILIVLFLAIQPFVNESFNSATYLIALLILVRLVTIIKLAKQ